MMQSRVNIVIAVDVIKCLSEGSLLNGNLSMMDDGKYQSTGQGTAELCTVCCPGQVVRWTVVPLDVQTPVAIKNITFLPSRDDDDDVNDSGNGNGKRSVLDSWSSLLVPDTTQPLEEVRGPGYGEAALPDGGPSDGGAPDGASPDGALVDENPTLDVWDGVVPPFLEPAVSYRYRLELQMYEGERSTLQIESPALKVL
ncbi:hypothetical protein ACGFNU_32835 [Spirillospora sp. NPDC048911]|uniref:hypothetical protein n=1 Tax=Spirillospora sp. NPDC048911 TaxID=3364527 RepID=UPI0037203E25